MERLARQCHLPWVVMGDLNKVVAKSENMGGRAI